MASAFNGREAIAAHQVLTRCPVGADDLRIVRLECPGCGSALQGNFTLGRLARLTREQLQFVEVFIRCRGKIKDVEEELGISYPTVVGRLNEVVQAMGFEVRLEDADVAGRRQQVLDELAAGNLTATEGAMRCAWRSIRGRHSTGFPRVPGMARPFCICRAMCARPSRPTRAACRSAALKAASWASRPTPARSTWSTCTGSSTWRPTRA